MKTRWACERCVIVAILGSLSLPALGTDDPPGATAQDAAPPAKSGAPLSGPKVADPAAARETTLVKRDFNGKLIRLEMEPARAAVELLELDDATRAEVDRVLLERDALMDQFVTDNLKDIASLANAFASKDRDGIRASVEPLWAKFEPIRARGLLASEIALILPPDKQRELESLTREYWRAAVADRRAAGGDKGEKLNAVGAMAHEALLVFGQEIKRSYERTVGQESRNFEEFLGSLNLTPEQESVIRREVENVFITTYGKPTKLQQAQMFKKVWDVLEPEQRKVVAERIGAERRAEYKALNERRAAAPKQDSRPAPKQHEPGAEGDTMQSPGADKK
jgi:hypothetical protein